MLKPLAALLALMMLLLAIVLMDHYLRQRAQNADVHSATPVITQAR